MHQMWQEVVGRAARPGKKPQIKVMGRKEKSLLRSLTCSLMAPSKFRVLGARVTNMQLSIMTCDRSFMTQSYIAQYPMDCFFGCNQTPCYLKLPRRAKANSKQNCE